MKTKNLAYALIITAATGTMFSCKKSSSSSSTMTDAQLQTQSDDQSRVSSESDAAFNDVNASMTGQASVTGSSITPALRYGVEVEGGPDTVQSLICDAVVTIDTTVNPRTMTITYNGKNCNLTRTRKGSVVISWQAGVLWRTANAVVTVTFQNLAITRLSDNKTITINGTHTYTNVSGGSLLSLPNSPGTSIIHTVTSSNMSVTFDDGSQRTWSVARQREYSYNNGYVITTTGTHTDGSTQHISEWGTNRFGNSFTTVISQPRVIEQSCNWQLVSGQMELTNAAGMTTISFGLNATGTATSCPVQGATYYFELVWTGNGGKTYTFILPY
jgi:hypothetical protein